jgi:hypothetical protein
MPRPDIQIQLDGPGGPLVEYGPGEGPETVDALAAAAGFSVDHGSREALPFGRFRAPLVRTTRTIEIASEDLGIPDIGSWTEGDRVAYADGPGSDRAWDRVRVMLARRRLQLVDDGFGYVVKSDKR